MHAAGCHTGDHAARKISSEAFTPVFHGRLPCLVVAHALADISLDIQLDVGLVLQDHSLRDAVREGRVELLGALDKALCKQAAKELRKVFRAFHRQHLVNGKVFPCRLVQTGHNRIDHRLLRRGPAVERAFQSILCRGSEEHGRGAERPGQVAERDGFEHTFAKLIQIAQAFTFEPSALNGAEIVQILRPRRDHLVSIVCEDRIRLLHDDASPGELRHHVEIVEEILGSGGNASRESRPAGGDIPSPLPLFSVHPFLHWLHLLGVGLGVDLIVDLDRILIRERRI